MSRVIELIYPASVSNNIAPLQNGIGGTPLVLSYDFPGAPCVTIPGMQRIINITGISDLTGVTFAVTGTDLNGYTITENIVGVDTGSAPSTNQYYTVISIIPTVNAPNVSVGTGNGATFKWQIMNTNCVFTAYSIQGVVTDTISYSVVQTLDPVQTKPAEGVKYTGFPLGGAAAITDEVDSIFVSSFEPVNAFQLLINSSGTNATGALNLKILQQGIT